MIYRFRVILNTEEDVFRDLEIDQEATLEDLHNAITQSFGFDGLEMASFYIADDEWTQGEEISQFDTSEGTNDVRLMNETSLDSVVNAQSTKLIYVYDFLNMWRFLVELAEIAPREEGITYPNLMYVQGQVPDHAPEVNFESDDLDENIDSDYEDFDDLDFDDNWI